MKQENVLQLGHMRQEHFFQAKHELTTYIHDFILDELSYQDMLALQKEYKRRSGDEAQSSGIFQFWFTFFHRFPNGLRGVEWFSQRLGHRLSRELQEMLQA